jgi:heme-degrading monooxygenase HmoA
MLDACYVVIFSSKKSADASDYDLVAAQIADRVSSMPGFIRMESVHDAQRNGITICYWESLQAIKNWKADIEHSKAQQEGKERWYEQYRITVAKIEYEYSSTERDHGRGIS